MVAEPTQFQEIPPGEITPFEVPSNIDPDVYGNIAYFNNLYAKVVSSGLAALGPSSAMSVVITDSTSQGISNGTMTTRVWATLPAGWTALNSVFDQSQQGLRVKFPGLYMVSYANMCGFTAGNIIFQNQSVLWAISPTSGNPNTYDVRSMLMHLNAGDIINLNAQASQAGDTWGQSTISAALLATP